MGFRMKAEPEPVATARQYAHLPSERERYTFVTLKLIHARQSGWGDTIGDAICRAAGYGGGIDEYWGVFLAMEMEVVSFAHRLNAFGIDVREPDKPINRNGVRRLLIEKALNLARRSGKAFLIGDGMMIQPRGAVEWFAAMPQW